MRPSPMDSLRRRWWRLRLPRRRRCSRCFWCGAPRRCRSRVAAPKTWTRVAVAVGRTYKELTGVPENLTQVIFVEVKHGNDFVGSVPPDTDQISVEGHLRTGRRTPETMAGAEANDVGTDLIGIAEDKQVQCCRR